MRSVQAHATQCKMIARACLSSLALFAIAQTSSADTQDPPVYVNVANRTSGDVIESLRDEILSELQSVKTEVLILYTDYASRAGDDVKNFVRNMTGYAEEFLRNMETNFKVNDSDACKSKLMIRLKKIEHDARRAAFYSGDNHHKFLLGHMIVFRMHINKSEDYLKKYEKVTRGCGLACESIPRVKRWRRLAVEEIHRVQDDMPYTKKSYRDLVSHSKRKLNHIKKQAAKKSKDAANEYKHCVTY